MLKLPKINEQTPDSERDLIPYVLAYNSITMSDTVTGVGTLNATTTKTTGVANLAVIAQKTGSHTDILTYSISSAV